MTIALADEERILEYLEERLLGEVSRVARFPDGSYPKQIRQFSDERMSGVGIIFTTNKGEQFIIEINRR